MHAIKIDATELIGYLIMMIMMMIINVIKFFFLFTGTVDCLCFQFLVHCILLIKPQYGLQCIDTMILYLFECNKCLSIKFYIQ